MFTMARCLSVSFSLSLVVVFASPIIDLTGETPLFGSSCSSSKASANKQGGLKAFVEKTFSQHALYVRPTVTLQLSRS